MHILIVGASGTVGGAVARIRSARRVPARALPRSRAKAAFLPPGISPIPGDLRRPETLRTAFAGAASVFLLSFQAEDEASQGFAGVEAAEWRAG